MCRLSLSLAAVVLAIFVAAPAAAADARLSAGLVGLWRFDGGDGRTVQDRSPLKNDGIIESGTLHQEQAGTSLELDGLGGHVLIAEKNSWRLGQAVTAAIWLRAADLPNRVVLFGVPNENPSFTTPAFGMYALEQHVVFGLWLNRGAAKVLVENPRELPLDTWTFLAGTYDGAAARLFVNGLPAAEKPAHGAITDNGRPLLVGRGLGSNKPSFSGRIGELRIYDRALSPNEIRRLFEQTRSGYDLSNPPAKTFADGTVIVETHGNSPGGDRPWISAPRGCWRSSTATSPAAMPWRWTVSAAARTAPRKRPPAFSM